MDIYRVGNRSRKVETPCSNCMEYLGREAVRVSERDMDGRTFSARVHNLECAADWAEAVRAYRRHSEERAR